MDQIRTQFEFLSRMSMSHSLSHSQETVLPESVLRELDAEAKEGETVIGEVRHPSLTGRQDTQAVVAYFSTNSRRQEIPEDSEEETEYLFSPSFFQCSEGIA